MTPRQRITAECARRGKAALIAAFAAIAELRADKIARVRAAAERAVVILTAEDA